MSHFIGLVFERESDYETMLEPFNEQTEDENYIEFDDQTDDIVASFESRTQTMTNEEQAKYDTLHKFATEYYGADCITDEQGNKRYGYYHNPNAKWDWYSEGGRWRGFIKGIDGASLDDAPFTEIDWNAMLTEEKTPFCFVDAEGEWHERGEMGWWAMVNNEKEGNDWLDEFKAYVQSIKDSEWEGDDVYVRAIDFHI